MLIQRSEQVLDEMQLQLQRNTFAADVEYSLADVVWTVHVASQILLGEPSRQNRTALARWYTAMKARPSFVKADAWDRLHLDKLLAVLLPKIREWLLLGVVLLVMLVGVSFGAF